MKKVDDLVLGQTLETVSPLNLIVDALRRMEMKRIHSLLVFENGQFLGIVTMTDVAKSMFALNARYVSDIMTPAEAVLSVTLSDGVSKCSDLMRSKQIHHLVVKDAGGTVVGVISSIDLMLAENDAREEAAETAKNLPPG